MYFSFAGVDKDQFVLNPGILNPGTVYILRLSVQDGGLYGYTDHAILTDLPPYHGRCTVSPNKGIQF